MLFENEIIIKVLETLKKEVPKFNAPVEEFRSHHNNEPFKVLISGILSARTKDEVTVPVCKKLFEKVSSPEDLLKMSDEELYSYIEKITYAKQKLKYLKATCKILVEKFNGKVPDNMEDLLKLKGVGRKVANVVLDHGFKKDVIIVDTHVHKIANRLGWVNTKTPEATEKALQRIVPKKYWRDINYLFVALGQTLCFANNPKCEKCPIKSYCKYYKERKKEGVYKT